VLWEQQPSNDYRLKEYLLLFSGMKLTETNQKRRNTMQKSFQCLLVLVAICLFIGPVGAADKPIKIASDIPLTGPYAADGAVMKQCLDMAVDEYNAKGGILGRKVEIVYGDVGALEPEKVKAVGERLIAGKPDVVITGYDDVGLLTFGETNIPYFHANGMSYIHDMFAKDPGKYSNVYDYGVTELEYALSAYDDFIRTAPAKLGWNPPTKKLQFWHLIFLTAHRQHRDSLK